MLQQAGRLAQLEKNSRPPSVVRHTNENLHVKIDLQLVPESQYEDGGGSAASTPQIGQATPMLRKRSDAPTVGASTTKSELGTSDWQAPAEWDDANLRNMGA